MSESIKCLDNPWKANSFPLEEDFIGKIIPLWKCTKRKMKIQNLNWITFDERKIHHLPAGDCMYDLKVGSCLESQGCGESKYLFNAEPFPLPELQEMRALKGRALPQKKKKKNSMKWHWEPSFFWMSYTVHVSWALHLEMLSYKNPSPLSDCMVLHGGLLLTPFCDTDKAHTDKGKSLNMWNTLSEQPEKFLSPFLMHRFVPSA